MMGAQFYWMVLKLALAAFCGDTPASNFIGGFKESVGGAYKGCRECMATKPVMASIFVHEQCPLRDEISHTQLCRQLEGLSGKEFVEASKQTGINFLSPPSILQSYQMLATGCNACPFRRCYSSRNHLVPKLCTGKKYFSLSELNLKVEHFHYNYHERNDKPSPIQREAILGRKKFGQNACQMWLFSILLSILIASNVPVGNQNWACFSILLKILAISMCRRIQTWMIPILKCLIKDHHEQFVNLYPGCMTPKYHFLVHLPDIICRFGPPHSYWCMRFEAKNRFFKGVIHGNFKNIPLTLASEHLCHRVPSALFS